MARMVKDGPFPTDRRLAFAKWGLGKPTSPVEGVQASRNMILDLYIADREGRQFDVSGLCLASGVASSTALRYFELLIDNSLIAKIGDADDGRRSFVTISGMLRNAIKEWLDQAKAGLSVAGWIARSDAMSDH